MTNNSLICQYLASHKQEEWPDFFESKKIKYKDNGNGLMIFNYAVDANFTDPIVQEARGIIIAKPGYRVVCRPFRKFGNLQESYADKIDWRYAEVQEKIDGSIIKLFFNPHTWKWQFATNGVINANQAEVAGIRKTYGDLIRSAVNYQQIQDLIEQFEQNQYHILDQNYTYIFELTGPENQVVIHYPYNKIWHTGTRNNKTGEEVDKYIGIDQPRRYPLHNEDECMSAAEKLNCGLNGVNYEGFVVVDRHVNNPDGSWNRIKIKSPEYVMLHHALNNGNIGKEKAMELILSGKDKDIPASPRINAVFAWYHYQFADLEYRIGRYIDYVRGLYEEYNHDRRAVAMAIKNDTFASFGFAAIGNETPVQDLMRRNEKLVVRLVQEYSEPNIMERRESDAEIAPAVWD